MSTTHYDVIVIGGGTMGTAVAWELGKRGVRSLVLEQFHHVHPFGAHGGKTRIFRHAYAEGADYVPLVLRADQLWQELERESGERVLVRCGGLEVAAPGHDHARNARASADVHGLDYEWLTPAEANRRWPGITIPADWEVLYSDQAGFLLTEPALVALAAAARHRGIAIHDQEPALAWGATDTSVWVNTAKATYSADRLIVTAGAWSGPILAELGLPLTIQRKVLWWLAVEDPAPFASERFPVFITDSPFGEIYGFPIHGQPGLKIANHAGGDVTTADTVDRTVRDAEKSDVVALTRHLFPTVTGRVLESAVCLYARTPDTDFIMDRHPRWSHVVIGAGFSGHGFKFTPAIGEHLVQLALDSTAQPLSRLALSRFNSVAAD